MAWIVFHQQPRHQTRDLVACRLRQVLPKWCLQRIRSVRRVEQLELVRFCVTAAHRHLLDSDRKASSLRSKQDRSKGEGRPMHLSLALRSTKSAVWITPLDQLQEKAGDGSKNTPADQTSTTAPQVEGLAHRPSDGTVRMECLTSRPDGQCKHCDRPKDGNRRESSAQ